MFQNSEIMRHTASHLLAAAVQKLYPGVQLGIGPAIENGFYYDFLFPEPISDQDLKRIQKEMKKLPKGELCQEKISVAAAREMFKNEPFKLELIADLETAGESEVSVFRGPGEFVDLCAGPHLESTREVPLDGLKLDKLAGAYWKGDEKNVQMTRIYGLAFGSKAELDDFLKMREEAQKRDHRKLGKELDLFCFSDLVGSGLPLITPRGMVVRDALQQRVEKICRNYGFQKVSTPHLAKIELFETSGHAQKFADELLHVQSHYKQQFVLKPVQCPHQTQIYASRPRSYKDLPIRYMESEKQYRDEKPGQLGGLQRVIAITVEDGHSFCRVDQVKDEVKRMVEIIKEFYLDLGLWGNHWVSLSVRDYQHPENYIGDAQDWDLCEKMLAEVCEEMDLDAKTCEGEAALYGPKIDVMFRDALGRETQIPTVQLDFATPKRFNLQFTNENGEEEHPVMVHRAILGSYERMMMLLIEHFAGAFPVWMAPVQAAILPVADAHMEYAQQVAAELLGQDLRPEVLEPTDTLGKRIRTAQMQKVPYMLIVGDNEVKNGTVTVRVRGSEEQEEMAMQEFVEKIEEEVGVTTKSKI